MSFCPLSSVPPQKSKSCRSRSTPDLDQFANLPNVALQVQLCSFRFKTCIFNSGWTVVVILNFSFGGSKCYAFSLEFVVSMELGSFEDQSKATFSLTDEDHTLANAIRFTLNQDPRVTFCGYSIPHPSDARVNIRVQTSGDPAREVLKDTCQDLMLICQHVRSTFDQSIIKVKTEKGFSAMDIKK